MPARPTKLRCPRCGGEMNHHANKCCDPRTPQEAAVVDRDLGGVVHELHACPACGAVAARTAWPEGR